MKQSIQLIIIIFLFNTLNTLATTNGYNHISDSLFHKINQSDNIDKKLNHVLTLILHLELNDFDRALLVATQYKDTAIKYKQYDIECLISFEIIRINALRGNSNSAHKEFEYIKRIVPLIDSYKIKGEYQLVSGLLKYIQNDIAAAMDCDLEALKYFKLANDTTGISKAYNNIGLNYYDTENFQKALDYYLLAIDFGTRASDISILNAVYNNLANLYGDLEDYDKSLYYYEKSLKRSLESYDIYQLCGIYNNMALEYLTKKDYKKSLKYFNEGLKLAKEKNFKSDQGLLYENMGDLYLQLNKYDSAQDYFNAAVSIYKVLNDSYSLASCCSSLASLYEKSGNTSEAIRQYNNVIQYLGYKNKNNLGEDAYFKLAKLYEQQGKLNKALECAYRAKEIGDSIGVSRIDEKVAYAAMQVNFKNKARQYDDNIQQYEKLHKTELNKERKIKRMILVFLIITIIVLVFLYWNFKQSNVVNTILLKKNREIQEQKSLVEITNIELKEQYAFTETLLNTIPNPVFYINRKGEIIGCNLAFEKITGFSQNELFGKKLDVIRKLSDFKSDLFDDFNNLEINQGVSEGILTDCNHRDLDVICYKHAIVDDNKLIIGIMGLIIDISDIRQTERSLINSQQKLQEANNAKDKFFNIMAHDLKNPFNAVLGLTHLISTNFESFTKDEIVSYTQIINQSATHIYNLLNNILEWARAQSGRIELNSSKFNINEPIMEAINLHKSQIQQKEIRLIYDEDTDCTVCADKNMINTVIRNIVANAIKYTPDKGSIEIVAKVSGLFVHIAISDSGIGISNDNMNKLFHIDKPISTPGLNNEKGTGLGLIISKEFLALNKGNLKVVSELGKGSSFIIELPVHC